MRKWGWVGTRVDTKEPKGGLLYPPLGWKDKTKKEDGVTKR